MEQGTKCWITVRVEVDANKPEQHRQPAALLVVEKLHHFRQVIDLHGDG
jgi:Ni,Fe-hydrogenase III component G